jgi:hypothetical protein
MFVESVLECGSSNGAPTGFQARFEFCLNTQRRGVRTSAPGTQKTNITPVCFRVARPPVSAPELRRLAVALGSRSALHTWSGRASPRAERGRRLVQRAQPFGQLLRSRAAPGRPDHAGGGGGGVERATPRRPPPRRVLVVDEPGFKVRSWTARAALSSPPAGAATIGMARQG